jgi:hypothetical protein
MAEAIADRTVEAVQDTGADVVYGFDTAMLPSLDRIHNAGAKVILEQCIAPRQQFLAAMKGLSAKLTNLGIEVVDKTFQSSTAYATIQSAMEQEEWSRADRIYCASTFVADSLMESGVAAGKIRVLPYGVTLHNLPASSGRVRSRKPKVIFGGQYSWRKGALEFGQLATKQRSTAKSRVDLFWVRWLKLIYLYCHLIRKGRRQWFTRRWRLGCRV